MRHCVKFKPDEVYFLEDTDLYISRTLSVGFCPQCNKPVAELTETNFAGGTNKISAAGVHAHKLMLELRNSIISSSSGINYQKTKSKPYGWKYGINKEGKNGKVKQFACDFYGNMELIKEQV